MYNKEIVLAFLREIARAREELHNGHPSSRPLSEGYEYIGLLGEWVFAMAFGLPIDLTPRANGDKRKDFDTRVGTIDIKTARKPGNLLREAGKPHADILVLAGYNDENESIGFLGWEYDTEMLKCPSRDFGYGILNHYKLVSELHPMNELKRLIAKGE